MNMAKGTKEQDAVREVLVPELVEQKIKEVLPCGHKAALKQNTVRWPTRLLNRFLLPVSPCLAMVGLR